MKRMKNDSSKFLPEIAETKTNGLCTADEYEFVNEMSVSTYNYKCKFLIVSTRDAQTFSLFPAALRLFLWITASSELFSRIACKKRIYYSICSCLQV